MIKTVKVIKTGELSRRQADGHRRNRRRQGCHRGGRRQRGLSTLDLKKESVATNAAQLAKTGKFGDLRRRLVFLLLALVVYRIGAHIPVPGINPASCSSCSTASRAAS
jgi:hypothetical protein